MSNRSCTSTATGEPSADWPTGVKVTGVPAAAKSLSVPLIGSTHGLGGS